jgi:phosphatase NudJ
MSRRAVPSFAFVLVLVEHAGRWLVVQEAKDGEGWYLPAGGVEPGESVVAAAIRETEEEAGALVVPTALLRVEQHWWASPDLRCKWRFFLAARLREPAEAHMIKTSPDHHSLRAGWASLDDLQALRWRHSEAPALIREAARGALPSLPLDHLHLGGE